MKFYQPGDTYTETVTTHSPTTGAATNADSLPTAKFIKNGVVDNAVTVTVTNLETGVYVLSATIPSGYAGKDRVQVLLSATVGGVSDKETVDSFQIVRFNAANFDTLGLTALADVTAEIGPVISGQSLAFTATTITLEDGDDADDFYVGYLIRVSPDGGTFTYQYRRITAYNGTTKVVTVERAWLYQDEMQFAFYAIYKPVAALSEGDSTATAESVALKSGPIAVTLQFRDADDDPVPNVFFSVRNSADEPIGIGQANGDGDYVCGLQAGDYSVLAAPVSGLVWAAEEFTVVAATPMTVTVEADALVPPTASVEPDTCVLYLDLTHYGGSETATLKIVNLPTALGDTFLSAGSTQTKTVNAGTGRFTFDAVPQGASVTVSCPAAKLRGDFVVPAEDTHLITEDDF